MCTTPNNHGVASMENVKFIADWLLDRTEIRPRVGIICGTGLGALAEEVKNPVYFKYEDIPRFPRSTVLGHKGRLIFGTLNEIPVMCMQGRFHFFEGYSPQMCAMPVRVMKLCGVNHLIVSNAAGGINPNLSEGDIMIMKDHINFMGLAGNNPLVGLNDERFGPRFFGLDNMYDSAIRKEAKKLAKAIELNVKEGVYAAVSGSAYESVAEVRMLGIMGADAAGMSTVHEVLFARHTGMTVFGFSVITNVCVTTYEEEDDEVIKKPEHDQILNVAKAAEEKLKLWVGKILKFIDTPLSQ